jgi:hypothetical protein
MVRLNFTTFLLLFLYNYYYFLKDEGVIVTALRNSDGELINPVDSINEHCGNSII